MWAREVFVKLKIYFPTETFQEKRKESECVKVSSVKQMKFNVKLKPASIYSLGFVVKFYLKLIKKLTTTFQVILDKN